MEVVNVILAVVAGAVALYVLFWFFVWAPYFLVRNMWRAFRGKPMDRRVKPTGPDGPTKDWGPF